MLAWIVLYGAMIISALTVLTLSVSFAVELYRWKKEEKKNG